MHYAPPAVFSAIHKSSKNYTSISEGMLSHSIWILLTTYAHFMPTMQDEAARLMDEILTPILIVLYQVSA
jgi:hypothetical protein